MKLFTFGSRNINYCVKKKSEKVCAHRLSLSFLYYDFNVVVCLCRSRIVCFPWFFFSQCCVMFVFSNALFCMPIYTYVNVIYFSSSMDENVVSFLNTKTTAETILQVYKHTTIIFSIYLLKTQSECRVYVFDAF